MASSTFEVTETESESEKELSFGLEATAENDIEISTQIDGEVSKDHNYTKDPDESEEELFEVIDTDETSPEPSSKNNKAVKKSSSKNSKSPKSSPSKKNTSSSKKGKAKKKVLTEDLNTSEINSKDEKEPVETSKKGKKRKVEEKENVIDKSIEEEVKNIKGETETEADEKSPAKKKKTAAKKPPKAKPPQKSKSNAVVENKSNQSMPKGWVKKEVVRKSGKSAGVVDVYIYAPDGTKLRSKPEVAAYLAKTNSNLKIDAFNFSKKKISVDKTSTTTTPKKKPPAKPKAVAEKKKVQSPASPSKKPAKLVVNFKAKDDDVVIMESTVTVVQNKNHLTSDLAVNLKEYQELSSNSSKTITGFCKESLNQIERESLRNRQLLSRSKELVIVNDKGCMRGIDPKQDINWNKGVIEFHTSVPSFDDDSNDIFIDDDALNDFQYENDDLDTISGDTSNGCKKSRILKNFQKAQSLSPLSIDLINDCQIEDQKNSSTIPVKKENIRKDGKPKKKPGRKPVEQKNSLTIPLKKENLRKDGKPKQKPGRKTVEQKNSLAIPVKTEKLRKDGKPKLKPGRKPQPKVHPYFIQYQTSIKSNTPEKYNFSEPSECQVQLSKAKRGYRPRRNIHAKSASEMLNLKRRKRNLESSTSYFKEMMSTDLSTIKVDIFETENSQVERNMKNVTKKTRNRKPNKLEKYGPKVLPPGWRSILIKRKTGQTAGSFDIYFITPEGNKLRSKVEIAEYIQRKNLSFKADEFCFRKSAYDPKFEPEVF